MGICLDTGEPNYVCPIIYLLLYTLLFHFNIFIHNKKKNCNKNKPIPNPLTTKEYTVFQIIFF